MNDIFNDIVNKIICNAEWLFSGIATNAIGAVLTSVGLLIGKIFSNKGTKASDSTIYVKNAKHVTINVNPTNVQNQSKKLVMKIKKQNN
ncbi:MAG: hypothetical protein FWC91_10775 [Defluviitaleaceae bacterium]|nr:hypothetical protein [Defluviitaleaceae bacterium]